MSDDPTLALQAALVTALHGLTNAGSAVFDRVPPAAPFPRITLGPGQTLADNADCLVGSESFMQIDVWSMAVGFPEAKTIAGQVRDLLNNAPLTVTGHHLVLLEFRDAQYLDDPDGLIKHVAMTFRALTEPS